MKKLFAICAGFTALLFASGCVVKNKEELPAGTILIDVRTPAEFAQRSIPGSILIPYDKIGEQIFQKVPDKKTPIALFCRSGRRSAVAKKSLDKLGFSAVFNLGGIDDAAKTLGKEIIENKK